MSGTAHLFLYHKSPYVKISRSPTKYTLKLITLAEHFTEMTNKKHPLFAHGLAHNFFFSFLFIFFVLLSLATKHISIERAIAYFHEEII